MTKASVASADLSNLRGAETCTESAVTCTISDLIRSKYPSKTWAFLSNLLGLSERAAKHRLAATRPYTIAELQIMLRSEDGFEVLQLLMDGSQPKWWWWAKRVIATADRRRQAAELDQEIMLLETSRPADVSGRRRIKGDLDAQTISNRKFAQAETALGFLHQDVVRGEDRAVAPPKAAPAKRAYAGRGR